jgi:hypothetical protein
MAKRRRGAPRRSTPSGVPDEMFASASQGTLRVARQVLEAGDHPLHAEAWASEMVAMWDGIVLIDDDPVQLFGGALVRYARRRTSPAGLLTLVALGAVAPNPVGSAARKAARNLGGRIELPDWAQAIGKARFSEGWTVGDLYGDQDAVILGFEHPGFAPHTLTVFDDQDRPTSIALPVINDPTRILTAEVFSE